jgi:predicted transcriptional regulator
VSQNKAQERVKNGNNCIKKITSSPPYIISIIKLKRTRRAEHVGNRSKYFSAKTPFRNRPLGRARCRRVNSIIKNFKERKNKIISWVHLFY